MSRAGWLLNIIPALVLLVLSGCETNWEAALFGGQIYNYEDRQEEDDTSPVVTPSPSPAPSPSPSPEPSPSPTPPPPTDTPIPDVDGDGSPDMDDCDSDDPDTYPGAPEYCDGKDNDCDHLTDEDAANPVTYMFDGDEDGYTVMVTACAPPDGEGVVTFSKGEDCDDTDKTVNSGAGNCPE